MKSKLLNSKNPSQKSGAVGYTSSYIEKYKKKLNKFGN